MVGLCKGYAVEFSLFNNTTFTVTLKHNTGLKDVLSKDCFGKIIIESVDFDSSVDIECKLVLVQPFHYRVQMSSQ